MDERDDMRIESEDPEAELKADTKLQKLREEIEQLRKEKQEYLDGWQRSKADYVNALKRFENDLRVARQDGTVRAVEVLLPALDALERAKEHGELPDGFQAILRQIEGAFKTLGLTSFGAVGEEFNPAQHEALGMDNSSSAEQENKITTVLEAGWKVGEQIIRPAKVRVAHLSA